MASTGRAEHGGDSWPGQTRESKASKEESDHDSVQPPNTPITPGSFELPPLRKTDADPFPLPPMQPNTSRRIPKPPLQIPGPSPPPIDSTKRSPRAWITHSVQDAHIAHPTSHTTARNLQYEKGSLPDGLTSRDLFNTFHKGYRVEQSNYTSLSLFAEVKLMEARTKGEQLGIPNAFMTAAACDILNKLTTHGGPMSQIIQRIRSDIYKSIYVDYDESWLQNGILADPTQIMINPSILPAGDSTNRSFMDISDSMVAPFLSNQITYFDLLKRVNYERQTLEAERDKWIGMNERLRMAAAKGPLSINSLINRWQSLLVMYAFNHWRKTNLRFKEEVKSKARFLMCWKNFTMFKAFNHWRKRTKYVKAYKHLWIVEKKESDLYDLQLTTAQLEAHCEQLSSKLRSLEDELTEAQEQKKYNDFLMKEKIKAEKSANSVYMRFGAQLSEPVTKEFIRAMTRASQAETHNICSLLQGRETLEELYSIPPDKLIMRWVNFHLEKMKQPKRIENFSSDLRDSLVYTYLLHSIRPDVCNLSALHEIDFAERARRVIQNSSNIGFVDSISVDNIVNASPENADLHLLFMIQLFSKFPRLEQGRQLDILHEEEEDDSLMGLPGLTTTEYRDLGYEGANPLMLRRCREFRALTDVWGKITRIADSDEISSKEMIQELGIRFAGVKQGISKVEEYATEIQQNFESALTQTEMLSRRLIGHRLRGEPVTIEDPREQKDFEQYTKINPRKIADLFGKTEDATKEMVDIEGTLVKNFSTIKSVFRHYAKGYAISSTEFWDFVKDCRLPSSNLPASAIDAIFLKSNMTLDDAPEEGDDNPEKELIPNEFVECLLRISASRWPKANLTLHGKLQKLIKENIIPKAGKADATRFRKEIYDPSVQEIFTKYRTRLEKIFLYYARQDVQTEGSKQHTDTINVNEFHQMCKECSLIDASFAMKQINTIFCNIQIDGDVKNMSNEEKHKELIFPEFLEGMAALCTYKSPDPYTPLYIKLDQFLSEVIIPKLQPTIKGLTKVASRPTTQTGGGRGERRSSRQSNAE